MKEKIKQKGFVRIPLLVGIIFAVVIASAGTGVFLYRQGKLDSFIANVSQILDRDSKSEEELRREEGIKQLELEIEEAKRKAQEAQLELEKLKQETERIKDEEEKARLVAEVERAKTEVEKAQAEAEKLKKDPEEQNDEEQEKSQTEGIPKREKPDVKLFVMSYCPFGLQAQKMFLSVYELLGEKADMGVYFLNYIMHGEEEINENLIQYCIQKQEPQKFIDYLGCFVKDGDSQKCLLEAKIDQGILAECIATTDKEYNIYSQYEYHSTWFNGQFPMFDVHTALNEQYGVRGSPTVVINGSVVQISPRSPEQFKQVVCQSFNSPPEECQQNLSEIAFSSGFGLEEGSGSGGDCDPKVFLY